MTTATPPAVLPSSREHDAYHHPRACCWLCAEPRDDKPWWRALRESRGLSEPPYRASRLAALHGLQEVTV